MQLIFFYPKVSINYRWTKLGCITICKYNNTNQFIPQINWGKISSLSTFVFTFTKPNLWVDLEFSAHLAITYNCRCVYLYSYKFRKYIYYCHCCLILSSHTYNLIRSIDWHQYYCRQHTIIYRYWQLHVFIHLCLTAKTYAPS